MNVELTVQAARNSLSKIEAVRKSVKQADLAEITKIDYPKIKAIKQAVSDYYLIPVSDIDSNRRKIAICHARLVAMYLSYRLTPHSTPTIGRLFGGKDHTCVIHARERITAKMRNDPTLAGDVDLLKKRILGSVNCSNKSPA